MGKMMLVTLIVSPKAKDRFQSDVQDFVDKNFPNYLDNAEVSEEDNGAKRWRWENIDWDVEEDASVQAITQSLEMASDKEYQLLVLNKSTGTWESFGTYKNK